MRRRKKEIMAVTSFRLPVDVKDFLKARAAEQDRTMSYVLVAFMRQWIAFADAKAQQPRRPTKTP